MSARGNYLYCSMCIFIATKGPKVNEFLITYYKYQLFVYIYFRDETFKRSLAKLREDILRANGLAREANNFAEELERPTRFSVTLQIPPQNLSPNRKVRIYFPKSQLFVYK